MYSKVRLSVTTTSDGSPPTFCRLIVVGAADNPTH
jgi:hypothetical protein